MSQTPAELEPMTGAVRAMVSKCLGALIYQNVDLATQVLESDDVVDQYRDRVFDALLAWNHGESGAGRSELCSFVLALRAISNGSPTTQRTSPRIFCSGCGVLKCATDAGNSWKRRRSPRQREPAFSNRVFTVYSSKVHPGTVWCTRSNVDLSGKEMSDEH